MLGASGLPAGAGVSFNPISVTGAGTSTLTVSTTTSTPPGEYALSLIGTSAGLAHTNTVGLVITPAPRPRIASIILSSTALTISGSNGPTNGTYYVLSTTNLALPISQWKVKATNMFNDGGNFSFTNSPIPAAAQSFFLLELQ